LEKHSERARDEALGDWSYIHCGADSRSDRIKLRLNAA